ncbi:hypothetical protein AGRA3207_006652 [Actinomadura graeca]|uniref:Uncharacterized protein n=1 Tax=Actinomadura graeca TaxID=2750812 RepID=A0ABX8R5F3_9ACTN|nr:hypothetical protein [Actinomadura graeca]QXJ25192.1 hypothetical protein AGRA3207_006652 [Actinomadura graeca]
MSDDPSTLIVDVVPGPGRRPTLSRAALAQIACTADAITGIDRVGLRGAPGTGGNAWGVLTCGRFRDLLG